jgi:hypothetical protein
MLCVSQTTNNGGTPPDAILGTPVDYSADSCAVRHLADSAEQSLMVPLGDHRIRFRSHLGNAGQVAA